MRVYEFTAEAQPIYRYIMPKRLQVVDRLKRRFLGVKPLAEGWEGFEVHPVPAHRDAPVADANTLLGVLAVSARFKGAFELVLRPTSEFLPLHSTSGEYYLHHTTAFAAEALDTEASQRVTMPDGQVTEVVVYRFRPEAVRGLWLFRIPQLPARYYATGRFMEAFERHGFHKGFKPASVWSEDPGYADERYLPEVWERIKEEHARRAGGRPS